ncbi:dynein light chain Tctex-type protein 2B [Danio rerio]|uniref:Dynein light chain Tctex-type protein 2B n=2 Tax=Danio rerio TaxID=7955 RepID=DYT2B_DANRE|nr:dynein light chain Tctex-type protein 2B [Danio rerio]F1QMY1.1 RecName: Full=Dynein light chain Tctex-type protein 2B; AltName: Full=Tctex1 domain-containing protein 2 [Danio rerio]|eukprot:XP_685487.3 tctex1 domain-containing protein 2 [Danio rerio]
MKPSCYDNVGKAVKRKCETTIAQKRDISLMDTGANTYLIRPNYKDKFKAGVAKECIGEILREQLYGVQYDPEEVPTLSRSLADSIKHKLKDMAFDRYKFIVQVVIGEQRGEGVKMAARCFWDADTDNYAQEIYMNDSLFCVAAAFAVYYY